MTVAIKRVYEPAKRGDGVRVLVDRLWPRGLTKERAAVHEWLRDLSPSDELRKWFHARPEHWQSFRKRYLKELARPEAETELRQLYVLAHKKKQLTLLFASKDEQHNNALVLKELLDGMRKPPTGTGPGAAYAMGRRSAAVRGTPARHGRASGRPLTSLFPAQPDRRSTRDFPQSEIYSPLGNALTQSAFLSR